MKNNIFGQTIWIAIIYLIFYYLIQILFVQQAVNTSTWLSRNITYKGNYSDASCTTIYCKCYRAINATIGTKEANFNSSEEEANFNSTVDSCIEADNVGKFVKSWAKKQSGYKLQNDSYQI